jgi:hypothetical protein
MTTPHEIALEMYYALRPAAIAAYNNYILVRTPAYLQAEMDGILAPNEPKIMLSTGQLVPVIDHLDAPVPGSPGTAQVLTSDTGNVKLSAP